MPPEPAPLEDLQGARVLAVWGDSVTTDHISPAGAIKRDGPAGLYLQEQGVAPRDFNSFGARRGNHEVMMRGTFANIRIRNLLRPRRRAALPEGGVTVYLPDGEQLSIYDAAMRYTQEGVPLVVLAGKEYGTGSSRDWAAKGTKLLGVRAVIAQSFERIHRSNLVGMGVLPLQFPDGETAQSLGLTGEERFSIDGFATAMNSGGQAPREVTVRAEREGGGRRDGQAQRPSRSSSKRACGSTRPARPTTTATAASSSTSCEDCSPHDEHAPAARRAGEDERRHRRLPAGPARPARGARPLGL